MAETTLRTDAPEVWRPTHLSVRYEVSDQGRVRNVRNGRILRGNVQRYGHVCVSLSTEHGRRDTYVHILAMEAFVGPCPDGLEVAHENGDASDNRLANLSYKTRRENQHGRRFHEKHGRGTVRHGDPVFLTTTERAELERIASEADRAGDRQGARTIHNILSRVGGRYKPASP